MSVRAAVLDSNLLVLFLVGMTSRKYIDKHKRLQDYTPEDFDLLVDLLAGFSELIVTPNTVTETSNLAAQIGEPARREVLANLRILLNQAGIAETYVESRKAAARDEYFRLRITDSTLLEASGADSVLITSDLDLYTAAQSGALHAINFHHVREAEFGW